MCGRFTLKSPGRTKFAQMYPSHLPPLLPRYNIAPSQSILAIIHVGDEPEASLLQWGLIPSWSKEPKAFINARAETLEEKPSFKESFHQRRCLIPADGFYEWERTGNIAQPYFFQMRDESPFAFAGIWDRCHIGQQSITSCAIVTTTANEVLASIHDRMPVILPHETYNTWLSGELETVRNLLRPFPASAMASHAVSYDVNHPRIDEKYLVTPVEPHLGVTLSLF
jgi:putative SOS response-associated peptidase YedK